MKVIIAGSRSITDYALVEQAVEDSRFEITEVVSGNAAGPDRLGAAWAVANRIPVKLFQPDWGLHGRAAGMIRNGMMAAYAEALIAIWDGQSKGTKNMVDKATGRGLKVFVRRV